MSSFWPDDDLDSLDGELPDYRRWLKRIVNTVDHAMDAEGVEAGVRDRVIARVMTGTPEPLPRDLAVVEALAEAATARIGPPMNAGGV